MAIYIGTTKLENSSNLHVGTSKIKNIYIDNNFVWKSYEPPETLYEEEYGNSAMMITIYNSDLFATYSRLQVTVKQPSMDGYYGTSIINIYSYGTEYNGDIYNSTGKATQFDTYSRIEASMNVENFSGEPRITAIIGSSETETNLLYDGVGIGTVSSLFYSFDVFNRGYYKLTLRPSNHVFSLWAYLAPGMTYAEVYREDTYSFCGQIDINNGKSYYAGMEVVDMIYGYKNNSVNSEEILYDNVADVNFTITTENILNNYSGFIAITDIGETLIQGINGVMDLKDKNGTSVGIITYYSNKGTFYEGMHDVKKIIGVK